jgi:uncharacterized membrane protein (UPF0136 family)
MTTTPPGDGYRREYATTVVGTPTQLANVITNHRTAGTLIAAGRPSALAYNPGRYQLRIRLREPGPARPMVRVTSVDQYAKTRAVGSRRRSRVPVITAVVGVVAGLLAVAAYLIGQLVELITAHAGLVLGVLALAALLAATATRRRSGRRHCPGC